ncbi:hypothetical protein FPV67DRAFT_1603782 [Lyophyllum atratum]|nr:hypothetical protein FPV67DRAFT_1603782 [Lyophyllum atratum]
MARQSILAEEAGWRVELGTIWDILGPFPIHAREQHYLSPSFPLDLSEPIDLTQAWPSSYADRGKVSWSTTESDANGTLKVSFPDIRWQSLRATEGWAALQHHAVLRGTLTVHPPSSGHKPFPRLLVNLIQGSFFTILPAGQAERRFTVPEWHAGNIYDMERALARAVQLPFPPCSKEPTVYHIFVSGDYEDVICDFIDGVAFGDAVGIALRSISGWWTVTNATALDAKPSKVALAVQRDTIIAPSQTRIVPLLLTQSDLFLLSTLEVRLAATSNEGVTKTITVTIPVNHQAQWTPSSFKPVKATYFYSRSLPTAFLAVPPILQPLGKAYPPILALHGAGVDIFEQQFWTQSIPRNKHSWLVFPSGRTSWGLDWHGPSARDVWAAANALSSVLQSNRDWKGWKISSNPQVVLVGHSNGGQGAWYLASRYPDRVLGVVPAAGYIKSHAYVPLTMSRSSHYIDPALRALLESSLTPDDNDLHLSNLVDTPVLAIHGGSDRNVPVWHSREAVSILQTQGAKNVTAFLDSLLADAPALSSRSARHFTLTVSDPSASGSLHGWKIESLLLPGRLARLHVKLDGSGFARVLTSNVESFSLDHRLCMCDTVQIGDSSISISQATAGPTYFSATKSAAWQVTPLDSDSAEFHSPESQPRKPLPPSRIQNILSSPDSIIFIVPDDRKSRGLSVALRLLDSEIMSESKAQVLLETGRSPLGNLVYVGDASSPFVQNVLATKKTPFEVKGSTLELNGQALDDLDTASMFLHPHPAGGADSNMLFLLANSHSSLERLARLFPIRTGVTVPSWVVTGPLTDSIGAAGIRGAG